MEEEAQPRRGAAPAPSGRDSGNCAEGDALQKERERTRSIKERAARATTSATAKQRQRRAQQRSDVGASRAPYASSEPLLDRAARTAAQSLSDGNVQRIVVELDADSHLCPLQGQPVRCLAIAAQSHSSSRMHRIGSVRLAFNNRGLCDVPELGACYLVHPPASNKSDVTVRLEVPGLLERTLSFIQDR